MLWSYSGLDTCTLYSVLSIHCVWN